MIPGDSIFALPGAENEYLQDFSGQRWRSYYKNGAQMDGSFLDTIPEQYADTKREGAVRTVIFDGGGDDVHIGEPMAAAPPILTDKSALPATR